MTTSKSTIPAPTERTFGFFFGVRLGVGAAEVNTGFLDLISE